MCSWRKSLRRKIQICRLNSDSGGIGVKFVNGNLRPLPLDGPHGLARSAGRSIPGGASVSYRCLVWFSNVLTLFATRL
jgi:hypothetical protein